jgi:hypothetical protein
MWQGLALVQAEGGQEGQLSFFPVWALAEEAGQRFQQLFRKQSKWTLPAIIPYIRYPSVATFCGGWSFWFGWAKW